MLAVQCRFECFQPLFEQLKLLFLFENHRKEEWDFWFLMVEVSGGIGMGATVLEQPVEVWLVDAAERSAVLSPVVFQSSNSVPIGGVSPSQRWPPPVAQSIRLTPDGEP